jgi:sporulation protein YlmC with PRC-barrel domain
MFLGERNMGNVSDILIGKTVLNAKGVIIGKVQESIKDSISGEVTSVLIKPSKEVDLQKYTVTAHGEIIFPFSSLSAVKDIIVIEEPLR